MEIFLVEQTIGQYEDRYITIEKAFFDKTKAEEYIEKKNSQYEGLQLISEHWERFWDCKIYEVLIDRSIEIPEDKEWETYYSAIHDQDRFIKFIKEYFPEDYEKFGEEKIRFAHDLYERGQLNELPFYSIEVTELVD